MVVCPGRKLFAWCCNHHHPLPQLPDSKVYDDNTLESRNLRHQDRSAQAGPKPPPPPSLPARAKVDRPPFVGQAFHPRLAVELLAIFIAVVVMYSILFVRREHIQYRPAHTFSVQ